ncbi:hypothetical protein N7532_010525 [Penicillium argentinense]|uniref:Erythromycin esterase n=1 Tax=Penicillium argentinense TaxID=1131581 RepID=A0A9W9JXR0_9EURO|nr:uncharacterized protein N7532_010525 [Penicillium argentinense]KAJ5085754.1 hypothetical protein N7532_010525 [Penicillium argentinense]
MSVRRSARLRSSQTPEVSPLAAPTLASPEVPWSLDLSVTDSPLFRKAQESTPQPEMARLASVQERDETPADEAPVRTPSTKKQIPVKTPTTSKRQTEAKTPTTGSAVRPPREEMHPSKAHPSTTKQADSGLILGFNPIKKDADGNVVKEESTPSKSKASPAPTQFGTPGYEFKFSQDAQLSDEAKRLMDTVRAEAAQIREKMIMDKANENGQSETTHGERKIAKPKGKAGRFSDVHMAEFKKMDSIANHPSSFRAAPGRFEPVTKSLKRTKSKAQLDEPEPSNNSSNSSPSRSPLKPPTAATPAAANAKRVKHNPANEKPATQAEANQPVQFNPAQLKQEKTPRKPAGPRPRSAIRNSFMTPTRASMAHTTSASLKAPKTSLIPSLARSPETRALASPRTPRTEFNPRIKGGLPTLDGLKSILRRRQPLFSRDPAKIAAGTHVAAPDFNPDSIFAEQEDVADSAPTPSPKKHVEFTPSVKSRHQLAEASPSRSRIPTTPSRTKLSDIVYPALPTLTPDQKATASEPSNDQPAASPTIRHVRKSNVDEQTAAYPEIPVIAHGIAHGIGNKKRHRDEVDDDTDNSENVPPADSQPDERSVKRIKATPSPVKAQPAKTPSRTPSGRVGTPASSKQKPRGVLSLSRLNMLAKPKGRA